MSSCHAPHEEWDYHNFEIPLYMTPKQAEDFLDNVATLFYGTKGFGVDLSFSACTVNQKLTMFHLGVPCDYGMLNAKKAKP